MLAAGISHTCALTDDGAVKCWGGNYYGQLGDGTTTASSSPVDVSGLGSGVTAIAAGGFHTCALTAGGAVKCWGYNGRGQLGDGTTTTRLTPVDASGLGSGVTAIAAAMEHSGNGDDHTCALTAGGAVKCWGYNGYGELGDGTTTASSSPVDVSGLGSGVTSIAAGGLYSCAVTDGGALKCWGDNYDGKLGDGTTATRLTPVDVSGLGSGVSSVTTGMEHTCAVTDSGALKCWGWNGYGQLGDGTTATRLTPVDVSGLGSGVTAIAAGFSHTCALTDSGGVRCWGWNGDGQLGDGTTTNSSTPVVTVFTVAAGVAPFGFDAIAVAAGDSHTCALTNLGGVKCWGTNLEGQLGDGTTTDRATAVDVTGFP